MPDAWLFDVYSHPKRSALVVWIKHGDRVYKRLVNYQPHFCVKAEVEPLATAEKILAKDKRVQAFWRDKTALWLQGEKEGVLRIQPKRFQDMYSIATDLRRATKSKGFLFFDVDNQPESRWMHEQGLWSMCRLDVCEVGSAANPITRVVWPPRVAPDEDRFTIDYPDPKLRTAHLGVLTDVEGNERDLADPLVAITLGDTVINCTVPGDDDAERETLQELGKQLSHLDPDVILTKHGDRFDIPFLLRRIEKLGLRNTVWLGRDADVNADKPDQASKSLHTYGRWLFKTHAYYLRGRWHIDLSKKTLDSEDDRKDIHGILYLSRVSNRRAQDCNRNGAGYALQQMQIDAAVDMGVALPWKRNLTEDWKDAETLCAVDRGGQIMVPTPGIYDDVAACDFSGYYPSLVVRHNLSSDTINCTCCPDAPLIPELNFHVCQKHAGHQSEILRKLWGHRRWAKAILRRDGKSGSNIVEKAKAIKSEHKALGVVCFGYFRYRNARFGCAEVHQAIQCYGRAGMTRARELAQAAGYEMVHTMTDCAFFHRPGITIADAAALARKVSKEVGVPMDVEGVYKWVVFLPSKIHSKSELHAVGVPNRYYGKFHDGTIKVRGIDVQRHSTPDWIHDVQQRMIDHLGQADDSQGFLMRVPGALQIAHAAAMDLRARQVDPAELGTMLQATKAVEDYRANTNTKAALLRLRDAGTERKPGEYVKYVVARQGGPWEGRTVPVELFERDSWFGPAKPTYHVGHYLRLLARSVETLLASFGYTEDNVLAWFEGSVPQPEFIIEQRVDLPAKPPWVTI